MRNYARVKRRFILQIIKASSAIPTHCQNEIGNGLCSGSGALSPAKVFKIANSANTPA